MIAIGQAMWSLLYFPVTPEMATVLITQCLQSDFLDPIGPHDPPPNLLHVGYSEAARLCRPESVRGVRWLARSGPTGRNQRRTASTCARFWRRSGVSWPRAKWHAIICNASSYTALEETERSFWRDSRGHADDRAGVHIGGYTRGCKPAG